MTQILFGALLLLCIIIIIDLRKKLKTSENYYNAQEAHLQSAKEIANEAIRENVSLLEQLRMLKQLTKHLETTKEEALRLQKVALEASFEVTEKSIRQDAVQRAKVINKGFDGETFSPLLQNNWNTRDFRHLGDPIDYIILDGADAVRAGLQEEIDSIVLLEIKTGKSDLNTVQRRIRDAVVENKVQFVTYNPDTGETRIFSSENPKGKHDPRTTIEEPIS